MLDDTPKAPRHDPLAVGTCQLTGAQRELRSITRMTHISGDDLPVEATAPDEHPEPQRRRNTR
ncbi:MAG TPA: hypothetical protein VHW04_21550 [Solirubrobacteraceae bacterium]|nr:hypothetical protein [Solirubrobacteraceae bacterium]